jgi:hypothetical protein
VAIGDNPVLGTRDYREWYAPVVYSSTVPADPDRRLLTRAEMVAELQNTLPSPGPVGHGYPPDPDLTLGASWAYDAVPGLLRVIAVDSTDKAGGANALIKAAMVDGWIRPALEQARADGVLVIVVQHHSTTAMDTREGQTGGEDPEAVEPAALEALYASYDNVIAMLVGHDHDHRVRAVPGADGAHPGYWEIMTSSLQDWPQQARLLEIVDNGNGTLSLFATLVDYDTRTCLERRFRRLSLVDYLARWSYQTWGDEDDGNVELLIPVPASAAAAVGAAAPSAPTRIESETTLRGQ